MRSVACYCEWRDLSRRSSAVGAVGIDVAIFRVIGDGIVFIVFFGQTLGVGGRGQAEVLTECFAGAGWIGASFVQQSCCGSPMPEWEL